MEKKEGRESREKRSFSLERMKLIGKIKMVKQRTAHKQKIVRVTIDFNNLQITDEEVRDLKGFMRMDKDAKVEITFVEKNQSILSEFEVGF